MMIVSRLVQRRDRLRRGRRLAAVLDVLDRPLRAVADHELLERRASGRRRVIHVRSGSSVGTSTRAGTPNARRRSSIACVSRAPAGEPPRAVQADREVAVAEVEPDVLAERAQLVHRGERVAVEAPAALVDRVGEPEGDRDPGPG